jgi:flagellar biosynthetic protein FlhB
MSGAEDEAAEKAHEASPQKLEEARRRGDVPRSTDLATAAAYAGLLLALLAFGSWTAERLGTAGMVLLGQADRLAPLMAETAAPVAGGLILAVAAALWPVLLLPAGAALAVWTVQRAILVTPSNLMPKLSRVSPIQAAKAKFGRKGLFDFAKSFVKLVVIGGVLWAYLMSRLPEIVGLAALGPAPAAGQMMAMMTGFLALSFAVLALVGVVDWLFQIAEHRRRNRMSRQELLDELKQSEGDPYLRDERRRRARAIATNRMMAEVPKASVVIVNPTHYAVALKWKRGDRRAPVCVAKGVDAVAARIREAAAAAGVPLHSDPATARALHAAVEIGEEVRPEHFMAVAAAIRFAETVRARARARRGG